MSDETTDAPPIAGHKLEALFDALAAQAEDEDHITVDAILDRLGHRSYGPLLLLPSLLAIFPVVGALPGVSYGMAFIVLFVAVQFALSKPKLWLPVRLKRIRFSARAFRIGVGKSRPLLRWLDGFIMERFTIVLRSPFPKLIAWLCVALGVLMVLYAAVPGGVVIPGIAVALLGLGLTTHDGLVVALGGLASVAAIGGTAWLVSMFL